MEPTNKSNDNHFDPTPLLKSSLEPILFIPFNDEKNKCVNDNCGNKYSITLLYKQKYCKKCLLSYINNIVTKNDKYLDVHIITNDTYCTKHEKTRNTNFCTGYIQEWCENCSEISYIKNYYNHTSITKRYISDEEYCKLCGKLIYLISFSFKFKICSNCYLVSSGQIESTLTKKPIPILYLPWWDTSNKSGVCNHNLKFISDCQKWCSYCFIIYAGCRHCLTTNIIFGITDQSQCRKCKRTSNINIDITNVSSGNHNIDEFLVSTRTNIDSHQIANYMNSIDKNSEPLDIYGFIENELKNVNSKRIMEWIPYSQITGLERVDKGGFGVIYKAMWFSTPVAVKRFSNSQDISKYFLNELKSLHKCCDTIFIIKYYGITQDLDPRTKDYMLIMEYASGGNLHNYLAKNFTNIKWTTKLAILCQISDGLRTIHNENFIHRDFHSGNILSLKDNYQKWVIGDLGLSQPANNLSNNEIYGVVPYVAPEIFNGAPFSKESDIYSMSIVMWELTTGCKPFFNAKHDHHLVYKITTAGKRPEITDDTPECFANLMKRCWDSEPSKRPSIGEIKETVDRWYKTRVIFNEAEKKRLKLIQSKTLGPEFTENHPDAIYTSRPLNSFISKCSSINSSSIILKQRYMNNSQRLRTVISKYSSSINSHNIKQGYNSHELDIDI